MAESRGSASGQVWAAAQQRVLQSRGVCGTIIKDSYSLLGAADMIHQGQDGNNYEYWDLG